MSERKFIFFLTAILKKLCKMVSEKYCVSYEEARREIYNSKLYYMLEDESVKMWYFSVYQLFQMFCDEKEKGYFNIGEISDGK